MAAGKTVSFKSDGSCSGSGGSGGMTLATEKYVTDSVAAAITASQSTLMQKVNDQATTLRGETTAAVSAAQSTLSSTLSAAIATVNSQATDSGITLRGAIASETSNLAATLRGEISATKSMIMAEISALHDEVEQATPPMPKTCLDIIRRDPFADSGIYTIKPPMADAPFKVYCDHVRRAEEEEEKKRRRRRRRRKERKKERKKEEDDDEEEEDRIR